MRFRAVLPLLAMGLSVTVACSFGVDLDGIFGGTRDGGGDAQTPSDAGGDVVGPPRVEASQVVSGDEFSCALRIDGTVTCWGWNDVGQLGDGTQLLSSAPVLVQGLGDATQIAAVGRHACAVRKGGSVVCWGSNETRQLGDGSNKGSAIPVAVVQLTDVEEVSASYNSTCARRKDGSVWCWGDNASGQLGDNSITQRSQPAPATGLADATQLASQSDGSCALVKSGEVYCWGLNNRGQVGNGTTGTNALVPGKVVKLSGVASIGSGPTSQHTCAVLQTGEVRCWGLGDSGGLGNGGGGDAPEPVSVVAVNDAVAVTTGSRFACAARKSGISCWGSNFTRQLGVGDSSPPGSVSSPVPVTGSITASRLAAGDSHVCALQPAGKISCWGADVDGRLGRGTRVYATSPVKMVKLSGITQLALGSYHGCAIAGGAASCWGANYDGQLGGEPIAATGTPVPVAGGATGVLRITAGSQHSCAVATGGVVACWGGGYYGNLGQGRFEGSDTPVVFQAPPASDVGAGASFTCALLSSGEVACSGNNNEGRLGQPGGNINVPAKVQVGTADGGGPAFLSGVTKLAVNGGHSCVMVGTTVRCWGSNYGGECGTNGGSVPTPFQVPLGAAKDVAAGGGHSCAILTDGSVRCWGSGDFGQLGGTAPGGPTPQAVDLGGKTAKALALGENHSCALTDEGNVLCWGRGNYGQLGNGVRADAPRPTAVPGLSGITAIAAHGDSTCAVGEGGVASCWGFNAIGQLGEGSTFVSGTPASVIGY